MGPQLAYNRQARFGQKACSNAIGTNAFKPAFTVTNV